MLPFLNFPTGVRTKKTSRGERERIIEDKLIAKNKRLEARRNPNVQLSIIGPIIDEDIRETYVQQIHEDISSICDNKITIVYVMSHLPKYAPSDVVMGNYRKPFLWVVTDDVANQPIPTVFGFAFGTLRNPPDFPSTFEMKLICSRGGVGMALFKEVLKYAQTNQPSAIFANLFTLEPINKIVSKKYEDVAQEFFGRPFKYMRDGYLSIVLNENEALHGLLDDETVSQKEFYDIVG